MKKITTLLLVLFSSYAFAQEKESLEGSWWVAGSFNVQTVTSDTSESQLFSIMPTIGKFISDDITIGLGLGLGVSTSTNGIEDSDITSKSFTIQPLVRKYWNLSQNLYAFGQGSLPVTILKSEYDYSNYTQNYLNISLNFAPGIDYRITKKFSIETYYNILGIGYNHSDTNENNDVNGFYFSGSSNTSFNNLTIGLKYHF